MHRSATKKQLLTILAVTAAYLVAASLAAWGLGNGEFVFYIVVMLLIIGVMAKVHHHVGLSIGLLTGLCAWGLLHMAGGLVPIPEAWPSGAEQRVLYNLWLVPPLLKYDQAVHILGFALTTWLCWQSVSSAIVTRFPGSDGPAPTTGLLTLCAAAGMGFGALNEVVEFMATLLLPETNVGGYENTGWDLVSNLVGCLIAALLIRARSPRSSRSDEGSPPSLRNR